MRYLTISLPFALLLSACSSGPSSSLYEPDSPQQINTVRTFQLNPEHLGEFTYGDFTFNPATVHFVDKMVNEHHFDRQQLENVLGQTKKLDWVIKLMDRQGPSAPAPVGPNGAWIRYSDKFITPDNVQNGVAFWNQHQETLQRAWEQYQIPPEIIVGIMGVETRWGRIMGKTRIIDALATLAFAYPRRAEFFTDELETYLLMISQEGSDPLEPRGSYAGAMGYGQFMPSSFKHYAVDFDGNGRIDLWDPVDAIGSVANYFKEHGWTPYAPIAIPANGEAPLLKHGFHTRYPISELISAGLTPRAHLGSYKEASLLRFDMGRYYNYWFGLPNFYTITRYNHSTHYAMAVWQLGEAVKKAR